MTESKAIRAVVMVGSITADGFMLPDGSYRMSQTQVAECIGDDPVYARNFLRSKVLESLTGEGYTPETFEVDPSEQARGQTRIQGWSLEIVFAYWVYRCFKGNKQAFALVVALGTETLERRFDAAFGVTRTEQERNESFNQRMQQMELDLRDALNFEAATKYENDYLLSILRQHNIDPWGLPGTEEQNE